MKKKENIIRIVIAALSALLIIWTVTPVFSGVLSIGMIVCAPLTVIFLLAAFPALYRWLHQHRGWFRAMVALLAAGTLLLTLACSLMVIGAVRRGKADEASPQTVIILGSRIYGEQPGRALTNRLDAALVYLADHPECAVIVTGGQAGGEDISNAEAMRRYLVARGIDDSRIFLEPNARNTRENLLFSREIIDSNILNTNAVIVTDGYHQFRAFLFARQYGVDAAPFSCASHWSELPSCVVREAMAIYRVLLLGY